MVEHDIMAPRRECLRSFRDRHIVDFHHAIGRYLGHKHFRDERQALIKGGVDPRDDHQEQEQQHEVNLAGQNQAGSCEDGGRHAQAHDHAGGVHKDARAQFAPDHDPLMLVDFAVESLEIPLLLVGGADLAHVFQRLLDAVGYAHRGLFCPFRAATGEFAGAEQ